MFERGMTEAKTSIFSPFRMALPGKRVCFWGAPSNQRSLAATIVPN